MKVCGLRAGDEFTRARTTMMERGHDLQCPPFLCCNSSDYSWSGCLFFATAKRFKINLTKVDYRDSIHMKTLLQ